MAIVQTLVVSVLLAAHAAAWTSTDYYTPTMSQDGFAETSTSAWQSVHPTGSVSGTLTNSSIMQITDTGVMVGTGRGFAVYDVTVTNIYLGPSASACDTTFGIFNPSLFKNPCPLTTASTTSTTRGADTGTPSATITTRWFAPLVIANPKSCTLTSFSYTSSALVAPDSVFTKPYSNLLPQATESPMVKASTTYVATLSTNLGGQAVTTSVCDIYLDTGAAEVSPDDKQSTYLSQCVDPSSFLCATTTGAALDPSACVIGPITYPPGGQTPAGTGGAASPTSSTKSGARSLAVGGSWTLALGLGTLCGVFLIAI